MEFVFLVWLDWDSAALAGACLEQPIHTEVAVAVTVAVTVAVAVEVTVTLAVTAVLIQITHVLYRTRHGRSNCKLLVPIRHHAHCWLQQR